MTPRCRLSAIFFSLLLAGCARAHVISKPLERLGLFAPGPSAPALAAPPLESVPLGERLEYQISWWSVPVATAVLTIEPAEDKKNLVRLTCRARSNAYLETFYPVRVELVSLIDPASCSPRRFQAYVNRRRRKHESVVTFDPVKGTAFHQLPKGRSATVSLGPTTQDGLSLLYYIRTIPFNPGQTIPLEVTADGKNWPLKGQVLRIGTVDLKQVGSYPAVEGQAELAYPVPFFRGARARVWFSADNQRIPLLAKISSRIGPVTVVLTKRSFGGPAKSVNRDKVSN